MANSPGRLIAFVAAAPSVGARSITHNLAAALRRQGQDVQLFDERSIGSPRTLPPARRKGRLVLVNAMLGEHGTLSPVAAAADDVVLVLRPQAESITAAYACVKRLQEAHALERLRVLVNHAADAAQARRILGNLAGVAGRYLSLLLEPAGFIGADPQLAEAGRINLSVVDAFPGSAASGDFFRLASDLLRWPSPSSSSAPSLSLAVAPRSRLPQPVRMAVPGQAHLHTGATA